MKIEKAFVGFDGTDLHLSMPLEKVDKERRLVSGWASLDNIDLQGDIVLKEASESAFSRFRGNIREMHQPIAVGRMVEYRPDTYFDANEGKWYNGIFVTVYVSKGAQSTWEKVLDGTLQAFSIKGPVRDFEYEYLPDAGQQIRIIKDYDLEELSLVDAGGNQLANIVSFQKDVDGNTVVKGMITEDIKFENVFYCEKDQVAKVSTEQSVNCAHCGTEMKNIAWFESDGTDSTEKIIGAIKKFRGSSDVASADDNLYQNDNTDTLKESETNKGGDNMADEKKTEEVVEETVVVEEVTEAPAEETVDEAAATDETAAEVAEVEPEGDLVKMISDLQRVVEEGLQKSTETVEARYGELQERVEAVEKAIDERIKALDEANAEITEKFNSLKGSLENVEKRLGGVEDGTAVKKSGDLGGSTEGESVEKSGNSLWRGTFLGVDNL